MPFKILLLMLLLLYLERSPLGQKEEALLREKLNGQEISSSQDQKVFFCIQFSCPAKTTLGAQNCEFVSIYSLTI